MIFFYNQYGDWKNFEFKANPWIKFNSIPCEYIKDFKIDFIEFLKSSIDNNKYLYFTIDRFYIPAYKNCYMKKHLDHDLFVYGYDDEKQQFYIADNANLKYEQTTVNYEEIYKSFYGILDLYQKDSEKAIFLLKVEKNAEVCIKNSIFLEDTYSININKIINDIKEYLKIQNYGEGYNKSNYYVYGIDCYTELSKLLNFALENKNLIDGRAFYSFLQHKKLMLQEA